MYKRPIPTSKPINLVRKTGNDRVIIGISIEKYVENKLHIKIFGIKNINWRKEMG
jgi:hypothetical protein